ncbi:hypothetical protein EMPG_16937 [Blastomyces silverae]|uniref:Uncharacterized protein n=1 Tax=Blastomyces silverae TaxID=2060906 RepID=A0A0H1B803_9EURO|nr:hypothetical protein EMPG_16937 [Blastomyces silverae]
MFYCGARRISKHMAGGIKTRIKRTHQKRTGGMRTVAQKVSAGFNLCVIID